MISNCNNNTPPIFNDLPLDVRKEIFSYLPRSDLYQCLFVEKVWAPIAGDILWKKDQNTTLALSSQSRLYGALAQFHRDSIFECAEELEFDEGNDTPTITFPIWSIENETFAEWVEKKYTPFTQEKSQAELCQQFVKGSLQLYEFTYIPPFENPYLGDLLIRKLKSHIKYSAKAIINLSMNCLILYEIPYSLLSPFPESILDHFKFNMCMFKCKLNNLSLIELITKLYKKNIKYKLNVKNNYKIQITPCSKKDILSFAQAWKNLTWTKKEKEKVDLWLLLHAATQASHPAAIELNASQMPDNAQCGVQDKAELAFRGVSEVCRKNHGYVYDLPQKTWNAIFGDLNDPTAYDLLLPEEEARNIKKLKAEDPDEG